MTEGVYWMGDIAGAWKLRGGGREAPDNIPIPTRATVMAIAWLGSEGTVTALINMPAAFFGMCRQWLLCLALGR